MKAQVVAGLPLFRPPCDAAEERELRAIALDVLSEALAVGKAASEFRGHRIRVDCWSTSQGLAVKCSFDGQVVCQIDLDVLWIKQLRANGRHSETASLHVQRELAFVFQGHPQQTW